MANRISNRFLGKDWTTIRNSLSNKGKVDSNWLSAISIIQERVTERYFVPIEMLLQHPESHKGAGFTIATIECSLIEFIASLVEGRVFLKDKPAGAEPYYYDDSADLYKRFLKTATFFQPYFQATGPTTPMVDADDFYKNVRCALVHEAQTKNGWEIRIFGKTKEDDKKNRTIFEIDTTAGKKVLYRTALHTALKQYFEEFCDVKLKENSDRSRVLRRFLALKIDYMLEFPSDKTKYWW